MGIEKDITSNTLAQKLRAAAEKTNELKLIKDQMKQIEQGEMVVAPLLTC